MEALFFPTAHDECKWSIDNSNIYILLSWSWTKYIAVLVEGGMLSLATGVEEFNCNPQHCETPEVISWEIQIGKWGVNIP